MNKNDQTDCAYRDHALEEPAAVYPCHFVRASVRAFGHSGAPCSLAPHSEHTWARPHMNDGVRIDRQPLRRLKNSHTTAAAGVAASSLPAPTLLPLPSGPAAVLAECVMTATVPMCSDGDGAFETAAAALVAAVPIGLIIAD
jgi:hypothetical protein